MTTIGRRFKKKKKKKKKEVISLRKMKESQSV